MTSFETKLELRILALETSAKRWKLAFCALSVVACCGIGMGAVDSADNFVPVVKTNLLEANEIYLVSDQKRVGGLYMIPGPDGKTAPCLSLVNGRNNFFVRVESESARLGFDCNEKPVFDAWYSGKATLVQVSSPTGPLGAIMSADQAGGTVTLRRDKMMYTLPPEPPQAP